MEKLLTFFFFTQVLPFLTEIPLHFQLKIELISEKEKNILDFLRRSSQHSLSLPSAVCLKPDLVIFCSWIAVDKVEFYFFSNNCH